MNVNVHIVHNKHDKHNQVFCAADRAAPFQSCSYRWGAVSNKCCYKCVKMQKRKNKAAWLPAAITFDL